MFKDIIFLDRLCVQRCFLSFTKDVKILIRLQKLVPRKLIYRNDFKNWYLKKKMCVI